MNRQNDSGSRNLTILTPALASKRSSLWPQRSEIAWVALLHPWYYVRSLSETTLRKQLGKMLGEDSTTMGSSRRLYLTTKESWTLRYRLELTKRLRTDIFLKTKIENDVAVFICVMLFRVHDFVILAKCTHFQGRNERGQEGHNFPHLTS